MMYLLDTNICIYAMKRRYPSVNERMLEIHPNNIFISSVTVGELAYGAAKSHWGERARQAMDNFLSNFIILPFTAEDAMISGNIRAELASMGKSIGLYDIMIAAQGLSRHLTIVTHNTREFLRVPGLSVEDWTI